jgi:LPXTG-motif cell wall-anchored protein
MFFLARHDDFSPPINRTQIHLDILLDFVARSDTISVDDTLEGNLHVTQAHVIEKLVLYNLDSHPIATYTASDYNPNGYYESRWWPIGIALIAAGLLIVSVAFFAGRKRRRNVPVAPTSRGL